MLSKELRESVEIVGVGMEVIDIIETTGPDGNLRIGVVFDDGTTVWDEDIDDGGR